MPGKAATDPQQTAFTGSSIWFLYSLLDQPNQSAGTTRSEKADPGMAPGILRAFNPARRADRRYRDRHYPVLGACFL